MSGLAVVAALAALALIALLPRIFFRRGRLNARWWLTASPFGLAGAALIAELAGALRSPAGTELRELLAWPALFAVAGGAALIRWTLHTHARPVSLWHQDDDRPEELMTRGAYARIRHPFYAAFLLVLSGCALAFPHALTLLALVGGWILLDRTAAREEGRLRSGFGAQYESYMRRSGRFLPRPSIRSSGVRTALVIGLVLLSAAPAAAQLGTEKPPQKVRRTEEPSVVVESVKHGAFVGLLVGMGVTAVLCALASDWSGSTGTLADEDDDGCDLPVLEFIAPPVIGAAAGAALGLLGGVVAELLGGVGDEPAAPAAYPR